MYLLDFEQVNVSRVISVLVDRILIFCWVAVCEAGRSGSEELKKCPPPSSAVL